MINRSVQDRLKSALDLLKNGDIEQSLVMLEQILADDLENTQVLFALRGVLFWRDKLNEALKHHNSFLCGEYLISQWKLFVHNMEKAEGHDESIFYDLKCCAFSIALYFYRKMLDTHEKTDAAELFRKMGLCYKALGVYDTAVDCLKYAAGQTDAAAAIFAELADAYALSGEIRFAKLFFREAFFKKPSDIEFDFLESEIIRKLIKRVEAEGYAGSELAEWLPVYGSLEGFFNVKRELKAMELGRLRQEIYILENELRSGTIGNASVTKPRLINCYFWLIDHYMNSNVEKVKIEEILLKIKLLDKEIYIRYIR